MLHAIRLRCKFSVKELTALEGVRTATDSVLAADISTFLILTVHLTGRIADGLAALLNAQIRKNK